MLSKMATVKYGPDSANKMINDLLDRIVKMSVQNEKSREPQKKVLIYYCIAGSSFARPSHESMHD